MCFAKSPKDPVMPQERQPIQTPKDNAAAAADRTKDRLRASANTILTGPSGASNGRTFSQNILGR